MTSTGPLYCRFDGGGISGALPGGAAQYVAGVGDLAGNEGAGKGGAGAWIVGPAVLLAPQQHIAAGCTNDVRKMAAVFRKEGNGNAGIGAGAQKERAAEDITETDDAAEVEQWQAQTDFLLNLDDHSLALLAEIGALRGDIEGIEKPAHGSIARVHHPCQVL